MENEEKGYYDRKNILRQRIKSTTVHKASVWKNYNIKKVVLAISEHPNLLLKMGTNLGR